MNLDAQIEGLLNVNVNSFASWIPLNLFKYPSALSSLFKTFSVKLFSLKASFWRLDESDEIINTSLNNRTCWCFLCFYFLNEEIISSAALQCFFFYCEADILCTFSDIPWPYLHSCQTHHTNSWRISCCNETEKQLLQRWNVRVWNHICTEQEVFLPYWVTPTSPQSQRRVCCRFHQDRVLGIAVRWVFHFCFLSFVHAILTTAVECQQHSLWINKNEIERKKYVVWTFQRAKQIKIKIKIIFIWNQSNNLFGSLSFIFFLCSCSWNKK